MSHFVIQGVLMGEIVYHRETPVSAGVENLLTFLILVDPC